MTDNNEEVTDVVAGEDEDFNKTPEGITLQIINKLEALYTQAYEVLPLLIQSNAELLTKTITKVEAVFTQYYSDATELKALVEDLKLENQLADIRVAVKAVEIDRNDTKHAAVRSAKINSRVAVLILGLILVGLEFLFHFGLGV